WQKPGQQNVAQELIKIIINYVAELRYIKTNSDIRLAMTNSLFLIEEGVCYVYNIEHYICNANHD
ncbi:hypothetical protein, partial [Phocaeicola dorei]|uniref:hypothetical protein n=1 Tax=Phocaeicola dorei TaxID=357276 RepID=UPI001E2FD25A